MGLRPQAQRPRREDGYTSSVLMEVALICTEGEKEKSTCSADPNGVI